MKGFECVSDYPLLYTLKTRQMRSNLCNLKQNQGQDYSTGKWPNEMLPTFAEKALLGKRRFFLTKRQTFLRSSSLYTIQYNVVMNEF
jgi:hypothetical protein